MQELQLTNQMEIIGGGVGTYAPSSTINVLPP